MATEILRLCFLYLKNREDAEDAAMETFSRALTNSGSFRGGAQPQTWLVRIAINVCKDMLKTKSRRNNMGSAPRKLSPRTTSFRCMRTGLRLPRR